MFKTIATLRRAAWLSLLAAGAMLSAAAPALASLGDEVRGGGQVVRQLQARGASCNTFSNADFEHAGEYVMDRMIGTRSQHRALNARMASVMGTRSEGRMHELMGRRYARCATSGAGSFMTPGMMSEGTSSAGGWGAMMNARGYTWMRDGTWQHMSRAQWRDVSDAWGGPGMMAADQHGWSMAAVMAAVLGALLLLALGIVLAVRRIGPRPPASNSA